MADRQIFEKPPLKEAVLEFRFQEGEEGWDSLLLGKIHARIEDNFPSITRVQGPSGVNIELKGGQEGYSVTNLGGVRRFATEDGSVSVTAGPQLLGVSVLPPKGEEGHPGWEFLRETAFDVFEHYWDVVQPTSLARVGVRYINHLTFQESRHRLGDYLDADSGWVPSRLLGEERKCACRIDLQRDVEFRERLQVQFEPDVEDGRVVVDIDEVMEGKKERSLDEEALRRLCNKLHDGVYEIFHRVVRDDVLESFEPVKPARTE